MLGCKAVAAQVDRIGPVVLSGGDGKIGSVRKDEFVFFVVNEPDGRSQSEVADAGRLIVYKAGLANGQDETAGQW